MRKLSKSKLKENILKNLLLDLERGYISGADIAVWQDDEQLFRKAAGYADIALGRRLREDSLFRLASMTKPVTAVAAMIGVERGWFSPSDDMEKHFPELAKMKVGREENGIVVPDHKPRAKLKLYQFLCNISGFMGASPLYELEEDRIPAAAYKSRAAMADWCLKNTSFTYEPGEAIGYCGYQAYDLIALLIERYSGLSWVEFLDKNIFEPLGIRDMTYHPSEEQWARLVKMYDRSVGGMVAVDMGRHTFESFPLEYASAGAGLVGSVDSYYRFAKMLLHGGELDGVRIVSEDSIKTMSRQWVPRELIGDAAAAWGLGVMVRGKGATLPEGSFGWSGAYGTHFWVDPENRIIAIYMKNTRWYDSHGAGKTGKDFERAVVESFE